MLHVGGGGGGGAYAQVVGKPFSFSFSFSFFIVLHHLHHVTSDTLQYIRTIIVNIVYQQQY